MAKKGQGWLRKKPYAAGLTWLFCFQVKKQPGATPVENTKPVGLVADLPDEKAAWMEVGRLGLTRYLDNPIQRQPKFNALAQHWRAHELRKHGQIGRKAGETADRDEHNLNAFILPRWGDETAMEIKPVEIENWFESLAAKPQGKRKKPLAWPTIDKVKSAMSQVFTHAQRHQLIPAAIDEKGRPTNPCKLARCRSESAYRARVVEPEQMMAILAELSAPEDLMEWTLALLHAATGLRPEETFGLKWEDADWAKDQIHVRRGWSKGELTRGKTPNSLAPVAMHPALAQYLLAWRKQSLYSKDNDWIFPSYRLKGKVPRAASTCAKQYLRPAAIQAGVIAEGEAVRFGWHNLRHSLATFFGSKEVPVQVIQKTLRQKTLKMTMRYTHAVNRQQGAAQGQFLEAIKVAGERVH
jgi:integrase